MLRATWMIHSNWLREAMEDLLLISGLGASISLQETRKNHPFVHHNHRSVLLELWRVYLFANWDCHQDSHDYWHPDSADAYLQRNLHAFVVSPETHHSFLEGWVPLKWCYTDCSKMWVESKLEFCCFEAIMKGLLEPLMSGLLNRLMPSVRGVRTLDICPQRSSQHWHHKLIRLIYLARNEKKLKFSSKSEAKNIMRDPLWLLLGAACDFNVQKNSPYGPFQRILW